MNTLKNIYTFVMNKVNQNNNGVEDVTHMKKTKKTKKPRKKTEARKLKDKIIKKQKRRKKIHEERRKYNLENNIQIGYESPPEYIIDETTSEDIYYSAKQKAANTYKNNVIHKTGMDVKQFYKEQENKIKGAKLNESELNESELNENIEIIKDPLKLE